MPLEERCPTPDVSPLRLAQHDIFGGILAIGELRAWHRAMGNMHTGLAMKPPLVTGECLS